MTMRSHRKVSEKKGCFQISVIERSFKLSLKPGWRRTGWGEGCNNCETDVIIQVKNDTIWARTGAVGRKSIGFCVLWCFFFLIIIIDIGTGHTHLPTSCGPAPSP